MTDTPTTNPIERLAIRRAAAWLDERAEIVEARARERSAPWDAEHRCAAATYADHLRMGARGIRAALLGEGELVPADAGTAVDGERWIEDTGPGALVPCEDRRGGGDRRR